MKENSLNGDTMTQNTYIKYRYDAPVSKEKESSDDIDELFIRKMINYSKYHYKGAYGIGHLVFRDKKQYIKDWITALTDDFMITLSEDQVREICSKKDEHSIRKYCQNIINHGFER